MTTLFESRQLFLQNYIKNLRLSFPICFSQPIVPKLCLTLLTCISIFQILSHGIPVLGLPVFEDANGSTLRSSPCMGFSTLESLYQRRSHSDIMNCTLPENGYHGQMFKMSSQVESYLCLKLFRKHYVHLKRFIKHCRSCQERS